MYLASGSLSHPSWETILTFLIRQYYFDIANTKSQAIYIVP